MAFSIRRLRTHASIALANALAIFITIYSGWTLSEATLAYLGEFVILALVVYARVLAAKRSSATSVGLKARCAVSRCVGPAFSVPHVFGLVQHLREGAYHELIADSRVMSPMWRYPPLVLAGIAISGEQRDGATIVPWFFVGTLALFAIVDAATYIYEQDAVSTAARRARALSSRPAWWNGEQGLT